MREQKKIAIIHNLTGGGGLRVLVETNKILSKHYKTEIFSPPKLKESEHQVVKVINYLTYLYKTLPEYYKKISKKINEDNFRAVIIHQDSYLKSPTSLFHLKTKTIYILHEPPREFYEPIYLHAPLLRDKLFTLLRIPVLFLDKTAVKKAMDILVNSKFSKKRIDKLYGVNSYVVYPGVKTRSVSEIRKRRRICISVGSLLPYKGHDLTIRAIGLMKDKPKLIVVGNGRSSEKKHLLNLAKKNKVHLEIKSDITDGQLNSIYKRSKVYVNSAYQEPFGMTSLEALSHGMNLVTVDRCGTEELKKFYKNDVTVVKRNPEYIAKGIEKMLAIKHKKQKIPNIFKWEHFASQLIKRIEK